MNPTFDFSEKGILVTGGDRGIGYAIARAFVESGGTVVIAARSEHVFEAAESLGANVHAIRTDLSESSERRLLIARAAELLGRIDVLVNNAGVQIRHQSEDFPLEDFEKVLEVNLTAVFELCTCAGREMLRNGYGKIVNLASMLSFFGGLTVPAYAASKGGVAQLTKALANDWAGRGVNVNAVAPGYIETDMNAALIADPVRFHEITSRIPAGRFGKPEEIAPAVLFLASDAASYLNGCILPVDGGYLGR